MAASWARCLPWQWCWGALGCLGAYGMASLPMTGPLNSIRLQHGDQVRAVIEPVFRQNWQQFAPDPVNVEM